MFWKYIAKLLILQSKNKNIQNNNAMKHIGSQSDFKEHRDNELHKAFARQLKNTATTDDKNFYTNVVKTPCSRFWVSELRAAEVVGRMRKGRPLSATVLPEKRRMYQEINTRVEAWMEENPDQPLIRGVEAVVWGAAPEFYMSPETARKNIRRILAEARERRKG